MIDFSCVLFWSRSWLDLFLTSWFNNSVLQQETVDSRLSWIYLSVCSCSDVTRLVPCDPLSLPDACSAHSCTLCLHCVFAARLEPAHEWNYADWTTNIESMTVDVSEGDADADPELRVSKKSWSLRASSLFHLMFMLTGLSPGVVGYLKGLNHR